MSFGRSGCGGGCIAIGPIVGFPILLRARRGYIWTMVLYSQANIFWIYFYVKYTEEIVSIVTISLPGPHAVVQGPSIIDIIQGTK